MTKPAPDWLPDEPAQAGLSINDLFDELHRHWRRILVCTVLVSVIAAGFAWLRPKYEATGFYYTPGWTLADFKRFRSEFGTPEGLASVLTDSNTTMGTAAAMLLSSSEAPSFWERAVRPLHPLTRKDAKEVFEPKDRDNSAVLGLEIAIGGGDPAVARDAVLVFGDFLSQTLMLTALQGWIASNQALASGERLKIDNQVLGTRYSIEQAGRRIADLQGLQVKYPESSRMDTRQVVNVNVNADPSATRYLAPIAQIVALESAVAESNENLRRIERRSRQLGLESAFFESAAKVARSSPKGQVLMDKLVALKSETFGSIDLSDDSLREVSNRIDLDLKGFSDQFTIAFGWRSPVMQPARSTRSPARFGLLGAALGLLAGLGLVLAPFVLRLSRRQQGLELDYRTAPPEMRQLAT